MRVYQELTMVNPLDPVDLYASIIFGLLILFNLHCILYQKNICKRENFNNNNLYLIYFFVVFPYFIIQFKNSPMSPISDPIPLDFGLKQSFEILYFNLLDFFFLVTISINIWLSMSIIYFMSTSLSTSMDWMKLNRFMNYLIKRSYLNLLLIVGILVQYLNTTGVTPDFYNLFISNNYKFGWEAYLLIIPVVCWLYNGITFLKFRSNVLDITNGWSAYLVSENNKDIISIYTEKIETAKAMVNLKTLIPETILILLYFSYSIRSVV